MDYQGGNTPTHTGACPERSRRDANGYRVRQTGYISDTCSSDGIRDFGYNIFGEQTQEHNSGGTGCRQEIYAGGRHLATYIGGTTQFAHTDWLGNERYRSYYASPSYSESCSNLPFGDALSCTGNYYQNSPMHFTGRVSGFVLANPELNNVRDFETGVDRFAIALESSGFGARYNSSQLGRFMSPDPLGGKLIDPQTLNKYSYVRNNPINFTDPTGLYTCKDDNNQCKTKRDIAFEKARQQDLKSKDADVLRAAKAYGDPTKDNHVSVGFAELDKKGEGGVTTSTLGADDKGNLFAKSDVTINSKLSGSALDAAVGHEGSHVADAQDVVSSSTITNGGENFTVGQDITRYQSEQRAYAVTDSILKSENENWHFACGFTDCILGTGLQMLGQRPGVIDQIMANSPLYRSNGQPLSPTNQGGSVVNGLVVPH